MAPAKSQSVVSHGENSNVGAVRDHNEDALASDAEFGLWLVADGMGGHRAGDVASRIARDTVMTEVRNGKTLPEAIKLAHEAILSEAEQREDSAGMGSTIVAVQVKGVDYEVAWVGDSRVYLWDGQLAQVTRDHSYVQDLMRTGAISPEEARRHPSRHLLTRCLGVDDSDTFEVGTRRGTFSRGQELLLCSDGLTDELSDSEIGEILGEKGSVQERVDKLVKAAIEHGGNDNVTVMLVPAPPSARAERPGWLRNVLFLVLGAGSAGILLGLIYYLKQMG